MRSAKVMDTKACHTTFCTGQANDLNCSQALTQPEETAEVTMEK